MAQCLLFLFSSLSCVLTRGVGEWQLTSTLTRASRGIKRVRRRRVRAAAQPRNNDEMQPMQLFPEFELMRDVERRGGRRNDHEDPKPQAEATGLSFDSMKDNLLDTKVMGPRFRGRSRHDKTGEPHRREARLRIHKGR